MVAEGRALPPLPPSLLGSGIGVGKGWEVVLKYEIRGRGGRRSYYNTELGEGRGVRKRHTLGSKHRNHGIFPGRFWREKSFVLVAAYSLLLTILLSADITVHDIISLCVCEQCDCQRYMKCMNAVVYLVHF